MSWQPRVTGGQLPDLNSSCCGRRRTWSADTISTSLSVSHAFWYYYDGPVSLMDVSSIYRHFYFPWVDLNWNWCLLFSVPSYIFTALFYSNALCLNVIVLLLSQTQIINYKPIYITLKNILNITFKTMMIVVEHLIFFIFNLFILEITINPQLWHHFQHNKQFCS